jgi:hypothetical protein
VNPNLRCLAPAAVCAAVALVSIPATYSDLAAGAARVVELCRLELKPGNAFTRVGPPAMPHRSSLVTGTGTPTLAITYTGFSPQAQAAFAHAASILEAQIRTRLPFKVSARMEALSSAGVLGFASTSVLTPGHWTPATGGVPPPIFEAFYPFPLADHLQNRDTTDPEVFRNHFIVTLNSTPNWYFGTDGAPPAGQVDFVSVVLHEVVHALGFAGHARVITSSNENWSCPSPPCGSVLLEGTATATTLGYTAAFDYFTKTVDGISLRNTAAFPHLSQALGNQLLQAYDAASPRGNGVYFDGPFTTHGNGGLSARLYTPNPFASGSSVGHVDESTYAAGDVNSLMTPFLSSAEAVHALGPVALGVLADTGWGADVCAARLGSNTQTVPRAGGPLTLRITLPSFCGWSLVNSASSLLTVSGASSGTGSATVTFTVAANGGAARSGLVTVNGVPYRVSQGSDPVAAAIHDSPAGVAVTAGQSGTFAVVAGGDPSPAVRWQRSTDGGAAFADLTESSTYGGVATPALTISGTTAQMDGQRFRAVASNGVGAEAASAAAALTVQYAPIVTTEPVDRTVISGIEAAFTVAVSANPSTLTYQWQRSNDGGVTWADLTEGSPFAFVTLPTMKVVGFPSLKTTRFRCRITNSIGSTFSSSATFSVRWHVTFAPSSLNYVGVRSSGGAITSATGSQTARVRFAGAPGPWTVTSDSPWLVVTGGSGSGEGSIAVSIAPGSTMSAGRTVGFLTLTSAIATNSPWTLPVTFDAIAASQPPFGSLDTPAGDGTVLAGSIALTGWTLDDIGVKQVELWRDLQPGETTPPFGGAATDPRTGKVFIANATFVEGARPDVEALNSSTPFANRAGWGYLMLTWGLWNQGNGTYRFHAFGVDQEGATATIGTKTVVISNNTATKPFGSIDTPGIGGDASGPNFGWGLTPKVNGIATCKIQPSGVQYSIDSGPLQPVVYGDARADIAGAFAGFSNTAAAGGHAIIDWTALTNGPHTIGWLITDDCNRADGVGSRFFNVTSGTTALTVPEFRLKAETTELSASAFRRNGLSESDAAITVAKGFGELPVVLAAPGARTVELKQGERIEVRVPRGFADAWQLGPDGEVRPLPVGSTWDGANGILYWQPAEAFLGRYRIVFGNGRERISVRVIVAR